MFFFAFECFFLSLNVLERNSECFIFCEMVRNGIPNFFIFPEMVWIRIPSVLHSAKRQNESKIWKWLSYIGCHRGTGGCLFTRRRPLWYLEEDYRSVGCRWWRVGRGFPPGRWRRGCENKGDVCWKKGGPLWAVRSHQRAGKQVKGIVQPFELGGVTRLIRSAVKFCMAGN